MGCIGGMPHRLLDPSYVLSGAYSPFVNQGWFGCEHSLNAFYRFIMIVLSGILPLRHVVMLLNFIKEIAHTDPEPYFSQSVLLMYGTNYVSTDFRSLSSFMRSICCRPIDLSSYLHI